MVFEHFLEYSDRARKSKDDYKRHSASWLRKSRIRDLKDCQTERSYGGNFSIKIIFLDFALIIKCCITWRISDDVGTR